MSVKNHHLPTSPITYSSNDGEWWSRSLTRRRLSVCRITKKLSIIEVLLRTVPHESLHLQHIITGESQNILFYTTAGKRDQKTYHVVIWLTNWSSMFRLWVIFNSTFVCKRAMWYGEKTRHKSQTHYNILTNNQETNLSKPDVGGLLRASHGTRAAKADWELWTIGGSSGAGALARFSSFCLRCSNLS